MESLYTIHDFMQRMTIYQYSALSADGSRLAFISNLTGSPQVWLGRLEPQSSQMLFPKPITTETDKSPHVMHPGLAWVGKDQLVILLDQQGDEQTFLEIRNLKTGENFQVPRGQGRDFLGFVSKDLKSLYFSSSRLESTSMGLYRFDLIRRQVDLILHEKDCFFVWQNIEPYRGLHFFTRTVSNTTHELKAIDLKTKKVVDVFSEPGTWIQAMALLPKGRLLVVTNHGRQFQSLAILDLKSKELRFLQPDKWDVEMARLSRDRKQLFVVRNVAGKSVLEHYTFPSFKRLPTKFKSQGVISSLDLAEKTKSLVIGYWSPTEPKNFYRLDLKNQKVSRLTDTWFSKIPEAELCKPQLIKYESNGKTIHSWFFLPRDSQKNKKTPVIVWPHGGPQWQEKAQFRPIFQYFVSKGFALWVPNHTGSTGYGADFTNAIWGQWGTADLPDLIKGIEWLKASGWIDPEKMGIMGGSYGGYMTLRALTRLPRTFRAAVDIFGVSNLLTFIASVPDDWKPFMHKMVGDPVKDFEKLKEQSPFFSLEKIDCPLLVVQGGKDPRVVKAESDQVVEKLRGSGKLVDYLVFEDEGHGFLKPENELKAYQAAADFMEKAFEMEGLLES